MNAAQRAFGGGEISPAYHARTDVAKYHSSLRTCRNFIVQQDGGVVNRPGTEWVAESKNSNAVARLFKFVLNEKIENTYVLEFGDGYIRFYQNGARINIAAPAAWADATAYAIGDLVSSSGVNYYCTAAHTSVLATNRPGTGTAWQTVWYALTGIIYEIPSPYLTADLPDLQIKQSGNIIRLTHTGYSIRELARGSSTKWILTDVATGPSISAPINFTSPSGGELGTRRWWAVTAVKDETFEESLPAFYDSLNKVPTTASPTKLTWDPVAGAISYNVYRSLDGTTYGLITSAGGSLISKTDNSFFDADESAASMVQNAWFVAVGQVRNQVAASKSDKAYDGKYTFRFLRTLTTSVDSAGGRGRAGVYYSRDGEARKFFGYTNEIMQLGSNIQYGPIEEKFTVEVPDNGYTTLTIDVVPEVRPFSNHTVTYNVLGQDFTWLSGGQEFNDGGSNADMAIAPPAQPQLFKSPGTYPATSTNYQQRAIYAGSTNEPERVWASRIGVRKSFTFSTPLQADDSIVFEMDGDRANAIKHLLDLGRLLVFTSATEKVVEGDENGILRPDTINPRSHSYNGVSRLPPIPINNYALYVQARSNSVRMIKFNDESNSISVNLSLLASHLCRGHTIVDWDYAQVPNSVVLCVRSDGVLLGLTYIPELDVWGWHRHDTDGAVENVCVVPENNEDTVYLLIRRTINGATRRYVERMKTRYFTNEADAWFVDSGFRYTGAPISSLGAGTLSHLALKSVSIYADGDVRANPNNPAYTVRAVAADGSLALGANYSDVIVGLPFTSDLETLDVDSQGGTIKGRKRRVVRVIAQLDKTRGLYVGPPTSNLTSVAGMEKIPLLEGETATTPITDTRDIVQATSWNNHGRVLLRQTDPLPAAVLMVSPEFGDDS